MNLSGERRPQGARPRARAARGPARRRRRLRPAAGPAPAARARAALAPTTACARSSASWAPRSSRACGWASASPGTGAARPRAVAFAPDERRDLDEVLDAAADAVEDWATTAPAAAAANRWNAWRPARATGACRRLGRRRRAPTSRRRPDPTPIPTASSGRATGWRQAAPPSGDDQATDRPADARRRSGATGQRRRSGGTGPAEGTPPQVARQRIPDLSALTRAARRDRRASRRWPSGSRCLGGPRRPATCATSPTRRCRTAPRRSSRRRSPAPPASGSSGSRATPRSPTASPRSWLPGWATRTRSSTLEPRTSLAYERSELVRDESAARVAALAAWRRGATPSTVLVASVQALFQHTLAPDRLPDRAARPASRASACRRTGCCATLVELGYESVPEVGGRGEFARRGGIVDVFPAGQPLPVRDRVVRRRDRVAARVRSGRPARRRARRRGRRSCRRASSCSATDAGDRLRDAARPAAEQAARATSRPTSPASRQGQLGDAAEIWAGHLAPATGARPPRRRDLGRRRARRRRRRGRLPVVAGGRAARRAGAGRRAAQELAGRLPEPRDWKRAAARRRARSS